MPKTRRIAIVGGGPRGLFALDSLCGRASQMPDRALSITLYEPSPYPGAGPVYAPDQPDYLLMNFQAGLIDAWDRRLAVNAARPTLVQWAADTLDDPIDAGAYVPRAVVGRYLMACLAELRATLPPSLSLAVERRFVTDVSPAAGGWRVAYTGGAETYDAVLIVTGHQRWQSRDPDTPISTFPTTRLATPRNDVPESCVVCRGFGLTFIDTALALTLGRGGVFDRDTNGDLVFHRSGREPARIQPLARTGRPMLAKPDAGVLETTPARDRLIDDLSTTLAGMPCPVADFVGDVWPHLLAAADAWLDALPGRCADWFAQWRAQRPDASTAATLMADSLAVARGTRPPGPAVALALVWRGVYPALVQLVSHGGLAPATIASFRAIATEMERIAFGPPAENVERLLALVHAGIVDLSQIAAGHDESVQDTVAIDATIAPPQRYDWAGPLPRLIERAGLARTAAGTLAVDCCGRALNEAGEPVEGLAIIGRVTELSVLGNDTLSRRLHPTIDNWAQQMLTGPVQDNDTRPSPEQAARA